MHHSLIDLVTIGLEIVAFGLIIFVTLGIIKWSFILIARIIEHRRKRKYKSLMAIRLERKTATNVKRSWR